MAMEVHASEKGQTTTHGSAVPRAPNIRDEEEGGDGESLGGCGESPHVVIAEFR